jgi:hypothetical protein
MHQLEKGQLSAYIAHNFSKAPELMGRSACEGG